MTSEGRRFVTVHCLGGIVSPVSLMARKMGVVCICEFPELVEITRVFWLVELAGRLFDRVLLSLSDTGPSSDLGFETMYLTIRLFLLTRGLPNYIK